MLLSRASSRAGVAELRGLIDSTGGPLRDWALVYLENHERRYESDLARIDRLAPEGSVLEVGSLPGQFTYLLKRTGRDVVGVDLDPDRMAEFIAAAGLDVRRSNIETEPLPFPDGSFDLVVCTEVLEHLRVDVLATLGELCRVTKPGGKLLLTTPNLYSLATIIRFLRGRGLGDPVAEWTKLRTIGHMGHVREYSPGEVRALLTAAGFVVEAVEYRTYSRPVANPAKALLVRAGQALVPRWRSVQIVIASRPT